MSMFQLPGKTNMTIFNLNVFTDIFISTTLNIRRKCQPVHSHLSRQNKPAYSVSGIFATNVIGCRLCGVYITSRDSMEGVQ